MNNKQYNAIWAIIFGLIIFFACLVRCHAQPGNVINSPFLQRTNYPPFNTNSPPLTMFDRYGSNLFSFQPSNAGSNYWHWQIGDFTPGKQLSQNISDVIIRMTANGYYTVQFGSVTNQFWTFGSIFSWGDTAGADQALFDRQARFFPEHIQGQLVNNAASPTVAIGAAAGSGGSVGVSMIDQDSFSSDVAMRIQLITGNAGTAAGTLFTVTFKLAYQNQPRVVFSPFNSATAAEISKMFVGTTTTTTFIMSAGSALTLNTTYVWNFIVIQ